MKITAKIKSGMQDVEGKPVFAGPEKRHIGTIITYDSETGNCTLEVTNEMYTHLMKVIERKPDSDLIGLTKLSDEKENEGNE